jgi:ABC-2 family transporter protein
MRRRRSSLGHGPSSGTRVACLTLGLGTLFVTASQCGPGGLPVPQPGLRQHQALALVRLPRGVAIGAASNDQNEAQQLASVVVIFVVLPVVLAGPVINAPDSTMATVTSVVPPFTPLLMLLRIVVKTPPAWQIAAGYLLTATFVAGLLWVCGRMYRVGILMHGKRQTLAELGRWVRYR